jgi:predicted S18 family serine protease
MPVRETDKRKQELQQREDRLAQLDKALRDEDWIERLANNDDFKKYLERVKEAQAISNEHRAKICMALSSTLKSRDQRAELNEQLIVVSATIEATDEVVGWPAAQEKRLADARKELPELKARIKELKGEN